MCHMGLTCDGWFLCVNLTGVREVKIAGSVFSGCVSENICKGLAFDSVVICH